MPKQSVLRIFVVDDRKVIASTLATILNQHGYSTVFFTNPLEALAMAAQEAPDCLISDVMMPELSGVDLAILISQLCPQCKILLFSGQAATDDLLASAREQGWSFELLLKPVHPTEILRRMKEHVTLVARRAGTSHSDTTLSKLGCQPVISSAMTLAA